MKVTIDIDCTPLEARQFFGLPDVQPMQHAVLAEMERRTLAEMEKFAPENLLQTWFLSGQQGADLFAKMLTGLAPKTNQVREDAVNALARALGALLLTSAAPAWSASAPPVAAENGMVASAQHLASQVGVEVLKKGGNAIDAAVAVGYALAVVYPEAGNIGGGGFMTIVFADGRETFIDFREKAPLAATRDMYLDKNGDVVKGLSTKSYLAVAVPGTVGGLEYAREKYGTMTARGTHRPRDKAGRGGLHAGPWRHTPFRRRDDELRRYPSSAAIFLNRRQAPRPGRHDRAEGPRPDLTGDPRPRRRRFLQRRDRRCARRRDQSRRRDHHGRGLTRIHPRELKPIECDYRGYTIVSAPPPSSGGVTLCEMLEILEGYPLKDLGFGSAAALHDEIETMRHAYVDRNNLLGDPDFVKNPVAKLIYKEYAAKIRAAIDPNRATRSADLAPGKPPHEGDNTTHYSIVDSGATRSP